MSRDRDRDRPPLSLFLLASDFWLLDSFSRSFFWLLTLGFWLHYSFPSPHCSVLSFLCMMAPSFCRGGSAWPPGEGQPQGLPLQKGLPLQRGAGMAATYDLVIVGGGAAG